MYFQGNKKGHSDLELQLFNEFEKYFWGMHLTKVMYL